MQTRTKSAFLLLSVLVLGIVIGILVSGVLVNRRMERIARLRTGPGIAQLIERAVEPESEQQRVRIREVIDSAAPRFAEVFQRAHEEMRLLSDSVLTELSGILNSEQMEDLKRHMELRRGAPLPGDRRGRQFPGRRNPRDRPKGDGPPPGMPAPPPE
jgi:hypothetical protein